MRKRTIPLLIFLSPTWPWPHLFADVAPGFYSVVFQRPAGFSFTPVTGQASMVTDFLTGSTAVFNVTSGQNLNVIDAGLADGVSAYMAGLASDLQLGSCLWH